MQCRCRGRSHRATAVCVEALEDRQLLANFVTINNVTQSETNGSTTFRFSLTRSADSNFFTLGSPTTVSYTTQSGSASAGADFFSQSGSVTFEAENIILIQEGKSIGRANSIAKAIPND